MNCFDTNPKAVEVSPLIVNSKKSFNNIKTKRSLCACVYLVSVWNKPERTTYNIASCSFGHGLLKWHKRHNPPTLLPCNVEALACYCCRFHLNAIPRNISVAIRLYEIEKYWVCYLVR